MREGDRREDGSINVQRYGVGPLHAMKYVRPCDEFAARTNFANVSDTSTFDDNMGLSLAFHPQSLTFSRYVPTGYCIYVHQNQVQEPSILVVCLVPQAPSFKRWQQLPQACTQATVRVFASSVDLFNIFH